MKLNKIFASHMVFAAGKPIKVYGEGCGKVSVTFAGLTKEVVSTQDTWMVELPAMEYGGPYEMTVSFEDAEVKLEDIYVGEVYLFAGQSNMQFKLRESTTSPAFCSSNDMLRLYSTERIEKNEHFTPDDGWVTCKREDVAEWSAIAYLAGNEISKAKGVAVGAIACYQGASVIESWVPEGTFQKMNICLSDEEKDVGHFDPNYIAWNKDGTLYSYGLSQVVPFAISGVVWYQGESDSSPAEGAVYADELCALIDIWRDDFNDPKLPFVVVQIADFDPADHEGWRGVQKAQVAVSSLRENVKTVISADVCETDDIHPKTKDKVAKRVADALMN